MIGDLQFMRWQVINDLGVDVCVCVKFEEDFSRKQQRIIFNEIYF